MFTLINILTAIYIISTNKKEYSLLDLILDIWAYLALVVSCIVLFDAISL